MRLRAATVAVMSSAAILAGCGDPFYRGIESVPGPISARKLGVFKVTYYWVADERDHPSERTETIPGLPGKFTPGFKKAVMTEGTGRLLDGRIINAAGGGKYSFTDAKWGLGCRDNPLVPLASIATDPKVIPTGSVVLAPAFNMLRLPDGTQHTGFFWADDTGGSIKGKHIDVFVGERSAWRKVLKALGTEEVEVLLVEEFRMREPRRGERFGDDAREAP